MPDMLVRNIKPETMDFLKRRAASKGRTVQDEVRELLDSAREREFAERADAWRMATEIRARLQATGRDFGNSAEEIREDRDSDHGRG